MNNKYLVVRISALLVLLFSASVYGQDRFANVTIETVAVAGNISMLIGQGGNIGVSAGDDGILIIDDQFAPLADELKLPSMPWALIHLSFCSIPIFMAITLVEMLSLEETA
ncbi:MAG: hypothetical protein CM1200mP40_07790 [Gammaproteobacteria bacterium]|nr:MAG: hypothetical protein CM1200mP40_07790 [Gammaproteobacteria bacterium]